MKHIKRLLPFLVLVFIVSSCGNSTSKDPVEVSVQLLNEVNDLENPSSEKKQDLITRLVKQREDNLEIVELIEQELKKDPPPVNKGDLSFRADRLTELSTKLNGKIFILEGGIPREPLSGEGNLETADTSALAIEESHLAEDSLSAERLDSTETNLSNTTDSVFTEGQIATEKVEESVSELEDSTLVAEATEQEPAEETSEEDESVAEASDEVDRGQLLDNVVPEGVMWFWIKALGIIVSIVVLIALGMHFIPKIMSKIQSGGFSWPSFSMGGVGTFFSGMFSGFSGVANRRRRRILIGSILGLLLLVGIGFALYQYGDSAVTAISELFTSDPDDRKVADHRDKKEREKITPAPYPPGYDEDGNPIQVSDSTETEEIEEIETEEEKKKGSGSGDKEMGGDKKLQKEIERLKKKLLAEEKARKKLERERKKLEEEKKSGTPPIKPRDAEKPRPKRKDSGFDRGGSRVATEPTKIPKQYGIGSDKDLSASRGGSR